MIVKFSFVKCEVHIVDLLSQQVVDSSPKLSQHVFRIMQSRQVQRQGRVNLQLAMPAHTQYSKSFPPQQLSAVNEMKFVCLSPARGPWALKAQLANFDLAILTRKKKQGSRTSSREKSEFMNMEDYVDWHLHKAPRSRRLPDEMSARVGLILCSIFRLSMMVPLILVHLHHGHDHGQLSIVSVKF